jgi:hypothetical protein
MRPVGDSSGMVADLDEVRRGVTLLADPEGFCQLVSLPAAASRTLPGRDIDGLVQAAGKLPGGFGVYLELNPVAAGLTSKAKASDIARRRWVLFDIDPLKAAGFEKHSASDKEKDDAQACAAILHAHLSDLGWPEPVVVDSGNGWYLLYRVDLPNDEDSRKLVRGVLYAMADVLSGEACSFDKSVHNADRLAKLPGTWAKKGPQTDDRPHRVCKVMAIPAALDVVPKGLLEAVGAKPKSEPKQGASRKTSPFQLRPKHGEGERAYALAALDGERTKLALTPAGDRDNQLYRSGAALGELVGPGRLLDSEVVEALLGAAQTCGLTADIGEDQVREKLARAVAKGMGNPRVIPERNGTSPAATKWTVPVGAKAGAGPAIYSIPELLGMEMPDPRWAIPGLLSEGLSLLAGKPKLGKSWLALNLALTIAGGGKALGSIQVQAGDVLYLALEDRLRRVRDRAAKVLGGLKVPPPNRLYVAVEWPRQDKGGVQALADWLEKAADPRLIVIDVWAKFRSPAKSKNAAYDQDYEQVTEVKSVADHYGASVLCLHHTRKSAAEDVFDEISGTLGIAGAADGSMVLARARGKNEGTLAMTGRDIEEQTLAVEFDPASFTWRSLGTAEDRLEGELQKRVLEYMKRMLGRSLFVSDIAAHLNEPQDKIRPTLHKLLAKNIVRHVGSGWSYPGDAEDEGL